MRNIAVIIIIEDFRYLRNRIVSLSEMDYNEVVAEQKQQYREGSVKITVLCVGKVKEKFYRDAVSEYEKRLGRYCSLEIAEVADERTPEDASDTQTRHILEKEGARMLSRIETYKREGCHLIALAIDGRQMSSVEFSRQLERLGIGGTSHIVFLIGGSLGLSDRLLKMADQRISFSAMTFPHQLMRVILLEQIYRAYRIMRNEPYHK